MSVSQSDRAELLASGLFDADWYRETYPDVDQSGLAPLEHYLRIGRHLVRSPGPDFDSARYLSAHEDLARANVDPLQHYIRHGRRENRQAFTRAAPAPVKEAPHRVEGAVARRPGRPTVMLCAHVAAQHLFGSERSLMDMLNALNALDFNVVVTVPAVQNTAYFDALLGQAMAAYVIPYGWWRRNVPINEPVIGTFCSAIAADSVDVVHVNTIMLREPLLAARRMGIRGIVHVRELIRHDDALLEIMGETPDEIVAGVWDSADLLIANSQATCAGFEDDGRLPVVVYNTADMDDLRALDAPGGPGPLRVAMISSNIPKKGVWDFCEVARALHADHPEVRFCLIGPHNEHTEQIASRIHAGDLPPSIELLGYSSSPVEAIAQADVVLSLSTFQESFGRTVLEGMAAGRPVIVYDHGGPPELVREGESGFVVPVGDTAAVADRLRVLAGDRARLARMGAAARADADERFGRKAYVAQMRAAYDRVLSSPHAPQKMVLPARADLAPTPRSEMKVAYFMWHFPVPSETFVLNELRILRAMGIDVRVFCRQSPYPDFTPDFDIEWESVRDPDHLAERLRATGRSIVHSHFVYPTVTNMVMPACERAEIPFTFIAHAQDIFRYRNDIENRIGEVSRSRWCRKVLVPSQFHFRYLAARGVPTDRMMLSANGCDDTLYVDGRIANRAARPFRRIVAIHRFTEKKGLIHLIRAGKLLADEGVRIALYGYGDLEQQYRDVVAQEGITNVEFCGAVANREAMLEVFRGADLFACPSVRASDGDMDGIPTVVMEAMSAGLPVLTTAISGIPDLVDDGITGIICDADPRSIAARVRDYYALPEAAVEAIIENGLDRIRQNYNSERLVEGMMRVWANETIDLMIVSWNNLPELAEVTRRLIANTSLPYHLVICDNGSRAATLAYLIDLQANNDRVTLILNRDNAYVGPGTNICLEHGRSDYAIYVCGKEGMTLRKGWELPLVHYMDAHPRVGQGGTLCYSPSYLRGRDYPTGVALFDKFRNRDFAARHPDRIFSHVQGGFFILRRQMVDEVGGFSTAVPHNYTDVEFSYFVESSGWELGETPGLKSLFNKTRPGLFHRIDEGMGAVHPPTLADLPALDAIANAEVCHCNICATQFPAFNAEQGASTCPNCGADRRARSVHRTLAESTLLFQRLLALGVNLPTGLKPFWQAQFQGPVMGTGELVGALQGKSGRLDLPDGRLKVILLNGLFEAEIGAEARVRVLAEAQRLMAADGVCLVTGGGVDAAAQVTIARAGLRLTERRRHVSRVTHYDWHPVLTYEKSA
ncbi:glycosyltransferase [Paracoccus sanguinis]|uniref:Glycosyltransferase involved in cell wall bisynthesis n=1 Tax=Paracoccus sanguinis TaxID=1545044 RepID=A0A1H3AEM8_9RHOB|nr:glycosyltransferase [Paracoccus sanguinis]SDX28167.1 Glycosyltransferase involved in cell wall bisynthesis [Paracoccus sanguinis]